MAHYENLPVYKASLDLAIYFEKMVHFFTRYHKYTIGTNLRNASRRILVLVAKANIKQDRAEALLEALEKLDELKILVKLCKEIKGFRSFRSFEFATKLIVAVSKQCEGWLKCQNSSSQKP